MASCQNLAWVELGRFWNHVCLTQKTIKAVRYEVHRAKSSGLDMSRNRYTMHKMCGVSRMTKKVVLASRLLSPCIVVSRLKLLEGNEWP